ncbi:hypothetical protein ABW20_dc0100713 [Dactylellina cionopaga]|nr:hypothetical protein ABW20_dc0100713 [Dactylellina cionopaga]
MERAHVLGLLPYLAILNIEGDLDQPRETLEVCPASPRYLSHFVYCIPSLQRIWYAARFVADVVRDPTGNLVRRNTVWIDTWKNGMRDLDVEMGDF